jgi:SAM-dependent methyltransferase
MRQDDSIIIDNQKYREICIFIDEYCSQKIASYMTKINYDRNEIAISYAAIQKIFKNGKDPDYNNPSVPVAYSLIYLPRRIMAMISVLEILSLANIETPKTVLDIGSGTDAVSIALGIYFSMIKPIEKIRVTALEPSLKMIDMAKCKPKANFQHIEVDHQLKDIDDIMSNHQTLRSEQARWENTFDMITFSASFPHKSREDKWWIDLLKTIKSLSSKQSGICIIIEPQGKINQLFENDSEIGFEEKQRNAAAIANLLEICQKAGWHIAFTTLNSTLSCVDNKNLPLLNLTKIKRDLLAETDLSRRNLPGWNLPSVSWNLDNKYDEIVLVLSREKLISDRQNFVILRPESEL